MRFSTGGPLTLHFHRLNLHQARACTPHPPDLDEHGVVPYERLTTRLHATRAPVDIAVAARYRLPRMIGLGEDNTEPLAMLLRATFLFGTIILCAVLLRELRSAARSSETRR